MSNLGQGVQIGGIYFKSKSQAARLLGFPVSYFYNKKNLLDRIYKDWKVVTRLEYINSDKKYNGDLPHTLIYQKKSYLKINSESEVSVISNAIRSLK